MSQGSIIKHSGVFLLGTIAVFFKTNLAHAAEPELQNGDVLHSATLTYNDDVVDLFRNTYIVSIVDQIDLDISFDVDSIASFHFYRSKKSEE